MKRIDKTLIIVSQMRINDPYKIAGKGFSEAFFWRRFFKKVIFIGFTEKEKHRLYKLAKNFYMYLIPLKMLDESPRSYLNILKAYVNLVALLFGLSKKNKDILVRSENIILCGFPTFLASKISRFCYGIWLGGMERKALEQKYKSNIIRKAVAILEYIVLSNAKFVFVVSNELYNLAKARHANIIIRTPNYVDLEKFRAYRFPPVAPPITRFLYAGRLEKEKGIDVLMEATKMLHEKTREFELWIIGRGSMRSYVIQFIRKHELERYVKIMDPIPHWRMPHMYNNVDIVIIPSYTEGAPAVLFEAMACGRPVIATCVGQIPVLIRNNINGILFDPGNSKQLADAMYSVTKNENLLKEMARNAEKMVRHTASKYVPLHLLVYEKLLRLSPR